MLALAVPAFSPGRQGRKQMKKTALSAAWLSAAAATVLSAIVGIAGPASADRVIHRDARHDVMKIVFANESDQLTPAPHRHEGDVTRAMIDHRYRRVVIKLRYAELTRSSAHIEIAQLHTSNQAFFGLILIGLGDGHDRVQLESREGTGCKGLWSEVDYRANTIKLSVPRRCLDNPEWVRAGVGFITQNSKAIFLDDALSNRVRNQLTMTRRLYRN
jgi:hypothetical protein